MSRNVLERVLWQLSVDRSAKERFRADGSRFLARFALSYEHKQMVLEFDVAGLQRAGVNPMLTMGFWQELAPDRDMAIYKRRLGASEEHIAAFSAALKG
ncbi:extradiol ring-cleavage dioxygenase [Pseudomonas sp.]|uniref:extradiol ring-cleavage dioxygenase n=1 Tax=Pseudomonas sp. TaxID=306 RepID=UPI002625EAE2|nr:extradiol ring-cleavage dioxygenase [Pseudomonas sp.]